MKNVLNAVTAICIILFLGWQFCGDCCGKKCDKSDKKECDYSKCEKSGVTKCKSSKTKKECPHSNKEEVEAAEENTNTEKPYLILVTRTEYVNGEEEQTTQYYKRTSEKPLRWIEPEPMEPMVVVSEEGSIFLEERDTTLQIIE